MAQQSHGGPAAAHASGVPPSTAAGSAPTRGGRGRGGSGKGKARGHAQPGRNFGLYTNWARDWRGEW
eukprot:12756206-Prorocentrum_lima.AAC.1